MDKTLNTKQFCKNRRLEMLRESQALEQRRKTLTMQGQQLQVQANQVNQTLLKLEIELELLDKLESSLNGNKEEKQC